MNNTISVSALCALLILGSVCPASLAATPAGVVVEAEHFKPLDDGWNVVMNGQGNYMVDIIGFQHISGERLLCADAHASGAKAVATVQIPEDGNYRVWSRFETPTQTEERFRVEIRQQGKLIGSAVMGEKDAPKYWFGGKEPVGQYDASWGSEGLAVQSFDVQGLRVGVAEITLTAVEQPEPAANRNVDFIFLTRDMENAHRTNPQNRLYPILDAALPCIPPRYYVRLTSPVTGKIRLSHGWNRANWSAVETNAAVTAGKPSGWIPLRNQDVCHFTTLSIAGPGGEGQELRVELAGSPDGTPLFRTIDWKDPKSNLLQIGLPAYPGVYADERIVTVEEQYRDILTYLKAHNPKVGRKPTLPANWGGYMPVWQRGRVADAAAELYHEIGMRVFVGFAQPPALDLGELEVARERFKAWGLEPSRSIALGQYRQFPTAENVAIAKKAAVDAGVLPLVQRFDYGDEIGFSEWLSLIPPEELKDLFAKWQQAKHGKAVYETPNSSAKTAASDPQLYADSMEFYEDAAIERVAELAKEIPKQMGENVLFGANVGCHPFYYPEIAKYIKWFRKGAANFGRHSEYFWQIGQPGPLINGYLADHFRSGMRDLPRSLHLQYTMPHSPGNSDASFRRSAFTHLAHGARGLDYFGIGINHTFTENYIDFRDAARYAAIRDVNRAVGLIEDILVESHVVPSKVALILSDSTERWDVSGIADDKAVLHAFGNEALGIDYKQTRLAYHMDRVGIYYALVHGSRSPDLLIEEDVIDGDLKDFEVAYWVGDCVDARVIKAIETWVSQGGRLLATAGAFRLDPYRRPLPAGAALLGLKSAKLDEQQTFFRPQIELPVMKPLDVIGGMPVFGVIDRVTAGPGVTVSASFENGSPAVIERRLGKGAITYVAALPGVTYLWSAMQPPQPPPRGVWSHQTLTDFNADARRLILAPAASMVPQVEAQGAWLDARLLKAPKGYALPLANYSADVEKPVTLTVRGLPAVRSVVSATRGALKFTTQTDGSITATYATGLGDILRIETK